MCPLASYSILSKFISFANDAASKVALLSYLNLITYMLVHKNSDSIPMLSNKVALATCG